MRSIVKVVMVAICVMVVVLCWTIGTTSKNQPVALVEPQTSQATQPRAVYPLPEPDPLLPIEENERMSAGDKAHWKQSIEGWAKIVRTSERGVHAQSSSACMDRFRSALEDVALQESNDIAKRRIWDGVHDPRTSLVVWVRQCVSCAPNYLEGCTGANNELSKARVELKSSK